MELGARIKSLRTQRGLSQEALAGQLEVSHQAVAKWESGKSQPSTANLRALCGVFGVSLDALVSGEEPAAPEEASPRPRRAAPMVLSAITLLSFSFSVSATIYAGNRHFPEQVIGGADGPPSILVSGLSFSLICSIFSTAASRSTTAQTLLCLSGIFFILISIPCISEKVSLYPGRPALIRTFPQQFRKRTDQIPRLHGNFP